MFFQRKNTEAVRQLAYRLGVCAFLIIATAALYRPVTSFDFVNFDDDRYVEKIGSLPREFTLESIVWSFTHASEVTNYWIPVTWLSFLVDYHFHGLEAGGYHLTNVVLHICNSLLLFLVLLRMTGALWKSAFAAALFAVHPLHVESVAWITERKDVLSTFFWLLTLWGYARYVQTPSTVRYLAALFFFVLGLLAKPMLVTLPFVLLLLDYWPFGRRLADGPGRWRIVWEKVPFLLLAVICGFAAYVTQRQAGALASLGNIAMVNRLGNALNSYVEYIIKTVWPVKLAVFYPYPAHLPAWQIVGALIGLAIVTIAVFVSCRRRPYLLVGWLWYLGTMAPVIGLVVIGPHALADRYTYIPLIGIFIALAWGLPSFLAKYRYRRLILSSGAMLAIVVLVPITRAQIGYWRDSISLFSHALEVTDGNYLAHNNLGAALMERGEVSEAINHYNEAIQLKPDYVKALNNLGEVFLGQGRFEEAIRCFSETVRLSPLAFTAQNYWGRALESQGKTEEAMTHYLTALQINPDYADAHNNLGGTLLGQQAFEEAGSHFKAALQINPSFKEAYNNLGVLFLERGQLDEATGSLQAALNIDPNFADANFNMAEILIRQGAFSAAAEHYQAVLRQNPAHISALHYLGVTLGVLGQLPAAIENLSKALAMDPDNKDIHNNLGLALIKQGRRSEASRHFSAALMIDPGYVEAQKNLEAVLATE